MRKITILSLMSLFCTGVFAQNMTVQPVKTHNAVAPKAAKPKLNTSKSVIWSDDFSVPANWTIAAGSGTTDNWVIGTTGPSGTYPIPVIASTTAANGFALFDSDLMCSGNQKGNLTTATSINCTGHSSVALVFQQEYERYVDSTFIFISTNGTTWTKFRVNTAMAQNDITANPSIIMMDISSKAANQATVWVRFTFNSPTSYGTGAGCGYSWMVDDVKLIDLPVNDIATSKSFMDLDGSDYYEIIPFSQMGTIKYGENVMNQGSAAQTNIVLNANINNSAISASSPAYPSLASAANDTIWAQPTIPTPAVPTAYAASLSVTQTETDEIPSDNVGDSVTFYADPTYFARTDNPTVYLDPYSFGTSAPAVTGMEYGANYQFTNAAVIDSIGVSIYKATAGTSITGKIYSVSGTTHTLVAQTSPYTLTPANLPAFIRLPLTTPYSVAAGTTKLCATVSMTVNITNNDTIAVLADGSFFGNAMVGGAAYLQVSGTFGWYTVTGTVPMVDLILQGTTTGINEPNVTGDFSIYPNPANEAMNIVSPNNIISVKVMNALGQVVSNEFANTRSLTINTSAFLSGIYFVQVQTEDGLFTRKITIR